MSALRSCPQVIALSSKQTQNTCYINFPSIPIYSNSYIYCIGSQFSRKLHLVRQASELRQCANQCSERCELEEDPERGRNCYQLRFLFYSIARRTKVNLTELAETCTQCSLNTFSMGIPPSPRLCIESLGSAYGYRLSEISKEEILVGET